MYIIALKRSWNEIFSYLHICIWASIRNGILLAELQLRLCCLWALGDVHGGKCSTFSPTVWIYLLIIMGLPVYNWHKRMYLAWAQRLGEGGIDSVERVQWHRSLVWPLDSGPSQEWGSTAVGTVFERGLGVLCTSKWQSDTKRRKQLYPLLPNGTLLLDGSLNTKCKLVYGLQGPPWLLREGEHKYAVLSEIKIVCYTMIHTPNPCI